MVAHPRTKVRADRLRPLASPRRLRVETDADGRPRALTIDGARCGVIAVQDRWRIDDEWWREAAVSRMYYQLQLDDDRVVTVYCDLMSVAWWVQRY